MLAFVCLLLIVVLPVAVLGYFLGTDSTTLALRANLPAGAIRDPLLPWQRLGAALVSEVPLVLLALGLWQARKCFALFAAGRAFTSEAVRRLRGFAGWVALSVVAGLVATSVTSALLTLNNETGGRHLAIGVGSDQVLTLLFAGLVWVMATVIAQGQALAEENAQFV